MNGRACFLSFKTLLLWALLGMLGLEKAHCQGEKFILLKRGNNQHTQLRFYPGETLTYKSKALGYFVSDVVVNIDKDYIYLSENILKPSDLVAIDIRDKDPRNRSLKQLSALFLGSGSMAIALEGINNLYRENRFYIDLGLASVSAVLLGVGVGLIPWKYTYFTLSSKNKVQLVELGM